MTDVSQAPTVRRFGAFEINFQSGELRKNGMRLRLSGQPFQVLAVLTERPGELVTREELHSKLWPSDTFVDFDHGLNNAIAKIREVLDDSSDNPRYIETIPRRGYRFIAPLADVRATIATAAVESGTKQNSLSPATSTVSSSPASLISRRSRVLLGGALLLVIFASGLVLYRNRSGFGRQPAISSLAVLPLTNLSGDSGQDYLADGMTEELIGRLAAIHNLRVISRTSVMQFKGTKEPVPEIAKKLGVDAVVEGSVIRDGNRIRVHAQLIRATTDEHFWSETYDRELGDVLSLQSDVAQSIASKVEVTVTGQEQSRLAAVRQVSPEVYESYLKGNFTNRNTKEGIEQSVAHFEYAIKKDSSFAPAYMGLARAYNDLGSVFGGVPPSETRPNVIAAAKKALELDPDLAEAHVSLADTYQKQWKWQEAEAEFERALGLKPNDAAAHRGYAGWLMCQGRTEEALAWSRSARELDPLGINELVDFGFLTFHTRHYDEALDALRNVLEVQPDHAIANWQLGYVLIAKGQPGKAIPVLEKAVLLSNRSPAVIGVLVRAYAHAGRRADALRLLEELKRRRQTGYVPAAAFVNAYLGLDDNEQAFVWLEKAYEEQSSILQLLKVHPHFDTIRNDPRFANLLHRVGLD